MLPGEWSEKFEFRNRPKDYQGLEATQPYSTCVQAHSRIRRVSHDLGWPANAMFFHNGIRQKQFFTLPVVNDNEIVRSTSDGAEGKTDLICLVSYI